MLLNEGEKNMKKTSINIVYLSQFYLNIIPYRRLHAVSVVTTIHMLSLHLLSHHLHHLSFLSLKVRALFFNFSRDLKDSNVYSNLSPSFLFPFSNSLPIQTHTHFTLLISMLLSHQSFVTWVLVVFSGVNECLIIDGNSKYPETFLSLINMSFELTMNLWHWRLRMKTTVSTNKWQMRTEKSSTLSQSGWFLLRIHVTLSA